jgi:hypothetical protein
VCDTSPMSTETRYGFPRADWELAKAQAGAVLAICARERAVTTYAALCEDVEAIQLRPYSFAMVAFLDEICAEEDEARGIVLASLVTRKDTGMPGEGYFRHAARLGHDVSDREGYWRDQAQRVWAAFGPDDTEMGR